MQGLPERKVLKWLTIKLLTMDRTKMALQNKNKQLTKYAILSFNNYFGSVAKNNGNPIILWFWANCVIEHIRIEQMVLVRRQFIFFLYYICGNVIFEIWKPSCDCNWLRNFVFRGNFYDFSLNIWLWRPAMIIKKK